MAFGFGISDFEYVFSLVMRVKNFLSDIADAPNDWNALRAEADCLAICLKVIKYKQSRRVLKEVSHRQRDDLLIIIKGCELNMAELIGFVAQSQSIAISESRKRRPRGWSIKKIWNKRLSEGINLWTKIRFVNKDKQPMREKIAVPTQSLNIYLVSLTFISLSYNTRLSAGPGRGEPPFWKEWEVVGTKVAFKEADLSLRDLLKPGVEDAIIVYADKISAGAKKGGSKKPAGSAGTGGTIKVPKALRQKLSFGPRVTNTDPDGLFLVRAKNRAQSRTRVNSSVEIVKAEYDFESDSGSDSVGFDGEVISPRRPRSPRSPPRGGGGGGGGTPYEGRSPEGDDPDDGHSGSGWQGFSNSDDEDEKSQLLQIERQGYRRARQEIKRDRKNAIREMTKAVAEEAEASQHVGGRSYSRSAEPGEPDVRAYMEVRYGVIIDAATPEEEAINSTRTYTRTAAYLSQGPRQERSNTRRSKTEKSDQESRHRSRVGEDLYDSDISSDPKLEPEIRLNLGQESSKRKEKMSKEDTINREDLFTIPRTDYISRAESYERPAETSDRERGRVFREQEKSFRNRETSLLNREESLRERERLLAARERGFYRRAEPEISHSPPLMSGARSPPIVVQPRRPEHPHFRSYRDDIRLAPEDASRPPRRAASYSGPSEEVSMSKHSSEDDSMYGPKRPGPRQEYQQKIPYAAPQIRRGSRSSSDDDKEFIVERRRK